MRTAKKAIRLCITGSEVMNGFVLDRNTQFFASELYALGYELKESRIIHDDPQQILAAWREFQESGDIIVNSGGLGPTSDDLTVDLLCEWLGDTAIYDAYAEKRTRFFFERRSRSQKVAVSIDVALRQARIPSRARAIKNIVGLAPGIFIPEANFFALPGFPDEIRGMWPETLSLIESLGLKRAQTKILPVWGVGESQLFSGMPELKKVTVGVHALPWGCRLFLRGTADDAEASAEVAALSEVLHSAFPQQINENPLQAIIAILKTQSKKLALAESCTGGLAAKQVTDFPGVSAVFQGAAVTYANSAKEALADVDAKIIAAHGAVSFECARAMAEGVAERLAADYALSFTGIAGPDGGTREKPVGTVFIGICDRTKNTTRVARFSFPFGRERFRNAVVAAGFLALWQMLESTAGNLPWPLKEFKIE